MSVYFMCIIFPCCLDVKLILGPLKSRFFVTISFVRTFVKSLWGLCWNHIAMMSSQNVKKTGEGVQ